MEARKYIGFSDWADVAGQFSAEIGPEPELVWASYVTPHYEGLADVVFLRDGKWKQVTGSHCSCFGLEGQWQEDDFEPSAHGNAHRLVYIVDDSDTPSASNDAFDNWLAEVRPARHT